MLGQRVAHAPESADTMVPGAELVVIIIAGHEGKPRRIGEKPVMYHESIGLVADRGATAGGLLISSPELYSGDFVLTLRAEADADVTSFRVARRPGTAQFKLGFEVGEEGGPEGGGRGYRGCGGLQRGVGIARLRGSLRFCFRFGDGADAGKGDLYDAEHGMLDRHRCIVALHDRHLEVLTRCQRDRGDLRDHVGMAEESQGHQAHSDNCTHVALHGTGVNGPHFTSSIFDSIGPRFKDA